MKKLIPFLSIAFFTVTACNTAPEKSISASPVEPSAITAPGQDTSGMAEFNAWKARNELAVVQSYQGQQSQPVTSSKPAVKKAAAPVRKPAASAPAKQAEPTQSSSDNSQSTAGNSGTGTANSGTGETAKVEKKEGWSKAAKGAVIGGVAGAAGGAVINKKNRVLGAVIGGVIGAAGGYGIGKTMDKKDGRIPMMIP